MWWWFAVGSGDGDDAAMVKAACQLHFTDGFHAFPSKGFDKGAIRLNAGGDDHHIRMKGASVFLRGGGMQGNVFRPSANGGGSVKHAYPCAMLHGEARRGASASSRSQNGDVKVIELHVRGCQAVVIRKRPRKASRRLIIQKRAITCVSFQPLSSKWWWMGAMAKMRLPWRSL